MRNWTAESKAQQAKVIHRWKPWLKAGVKTPEGKDISKMNAYKHGGYGAQAKLVRQTIDQCRQALKQFHNEIIESNV